MSTASAGVESRPSETVSVVAHAGAWRNPVPTIAAVVSVTEATALTASKAVPVDSGASGEVMTSPAATA